MKFLCSQWLAAPLMAALLSIAAPALAQTPAAGSASGELRSIMQTLQEIRVQYRARKWGGAGLFMKMKKSFAHTTPQLLTRVSPEELGHFSYALATLEEGFVAMDPEQVEQGYRLSKASMLELENRFPAELSLEVQDLKQAVATSAACAARGDFTGAQESLEDLAGGRRRLDNAGMSYAKESWVHFGLVAEDLARAVRGKNNAGAQKAAAQAQQDLDDLLDRVPGR